MALINSKSHEYCLYFAENTDFEVINKYNRIFSKKFDSLKFNKHFLKGKTTKHRKGKVEQKLAKYRNAVRLINIIIFYKKQMKGNKVIMESSLDYCNKSLYNFLLGGEE